MPVKSLQAVSFPTQLKSRLAFFLVVLSILVFAARGIHDEREVLKFRDFKQPYASARCLLKGCNPYSERDTAAAFTQADGVDDDDKVFQPYSALYPPFSLAMLAPVAALPYPVAEKVWLVATSLLFGIAVLLIAELCVPYGSLAVAVVLAMLTVSSTILLMLGQVSGPVIALIVIGLWCLLRQRFLWLAPICLTLAFVLKPHDAALLILYLPFAGPIWRRAFWQTTAATALIVVAGTLWCAHQPASAHWLQDLEANLKGNSTAGNVNDPGTGNYEAVNMANLQALLAPLLPAQKTYTVAAAAVSLLILAAWAWLALRTPQSLPKHLLAIASMSCILLLPVYHRQYDTRILLLLLPATAWLLLYRRRSWGIAALCLSGFGVIVTAHQFLGVLTRTHHPAILHASALRTVLMYRPLPFIELILACFFLAAFWALPGAGELQNAA